MNVNDFFFLVPPGFFKKEKKRACRILKFLPTEFSQHNMILILKI